MARPAIAEGRTTSELGLGAAILAIFLWTAGNLIVRSTPMPGAQIALWRVALGAGVYWVLVRARGRRVTWTHLTVSAAAGAAIALELAFFFVAIKSTTVANATVLGALQPLVVIAFGSRHFGERVTPWLIGSAVAAMAGVGLVVFGSSAQPVWSPRGDVLAFVSMLLFAAYFIFAKSARREVPALEFQTAAWMVGVVVLAPVAIIDAGGLVLPSWEQWMWLAVLLAIPGTGHFAMNWAHQHVRLQVSSMLTLAIPVLSTLGAALVLDESIRGWQLIGMVVVVAALASVIGRS